MDINTEKTDENPDFGRGLYVCEKPGVEFSSVGRTGAGASAIASQGYSVMLMTPVLGFLLLRSFSGVPTWVALLLAGIALVVILIGGISVFRRLNSSSGNRGGSALIAQKLTDSRYRIRAVIPKKRQESEMIKWAHLTAESAINKGEPEADIDADELEAVRGGFEPIIVRPWFGLRRPPRYWWAAVVMGGVVVSGVVYGLGLVLGGWGALMDVMGLMGYGLIALGMVSGPLCSELMWPVYIRLVPGQLDIFRYGFLGSGEPEVESFDLCAAGVCVDFGMYMVSLEPPREVGTPLPELVGVNGMVYRKEFPADYQPTYFSVFLAPGRREFAQRLIQGARTDELTPPVSMVRLGE